MKNLSSRSPKRKKIILISITAIVFALAAYTTYAYMAGNFPFSGDAERDDAELLQERENDVDYDPATDDQKQAGEKQKQSTAPPNVDTKEEPVSGGSHTNSNDLGVTITSLNQIDGQVRARSLIDTVTTSGSCTLTLTSGSTSVVKYSDIAALPSSSTCKGFDIPTPELFAGVWQVKLTVETGGKQASTTKTLTVQ